jgi:transketolase
MAGTESVKHQVDIELDLAHEVAQQLRVDSIRCSTRAGSGHPTSGMSAADLMAVLLTRHLRYDWAVPDAPTNDHLIFSKGHASPLLYAMFKAVGVISDEELMTEYRRAGSSLQGHPTPELPWVDVATGSLGQGLPIAVGVALAGARLDRLPYHVWALCGDSEMAEGSVWEAFDVASHYGLTNLTAIIDVNRLGQRGETKFGWDLEPYRRRIEAFGWRAIVIDGHDLAQVDGALGEAREATQQPVAIIARTVKGKGVAEIADKDGWHGKALPADLAERAIVELGGRRDLRIKVAVPRHDELPTVHDDPVRVDLPVYEKGARVATRRAYGDALCALAARGDVVALDAEVSNSTYSEDFAKVAPGRFFEMFIAEQQLVATAVGMSVRGYIPFASTFGAFFSRAYDFIRMAAISGANLRLAGSHAGVEIGEDGPSQMALEDLAAMRVIHGSTVLYPSDATSAARLVEVMAQTQGIVYMRTTRGAYPVLYGPEESFAVGGSKVLRSHDDDQVALVGAGVTLHQCLAAADRLEGEGIRTRVIDLYSVKPVDAETLAAAAQVTGGRLIVVTSLGREVPRISWTVQESPRHILPPRRKGWCSRHDDAAHQSQLASWAAGHCPVPGHPDWPCLHHEDPPVPHKMISMGRAQPAASAAHRPVMLAIAGDSAAGKTTLTAGLVEALGPERVTGVCVDDYHRYDREERKSLSFTPLHPDCNYIEIMEQHLKLLSRGEPILKPVYNHATGTFGRPEFVQPKAFVIVEGLLPLHSKLARACFDVRVYLDPAEEVRREWKIRRDSTKRGYTREQVLTELDRREPEAAAFIRPQRANADIVVQFAPIEGANREATLSVTVLLRPTVEHPDLSAVLTDDTRRALHLKLIRDQDGKPVDALHIHSHAPRELSREVERHIWGSLGVGGDLPETLGMVEPGLRTEPLALTELILLYHMLQVLSANRGATAR